MSNKKTNELKKQGLTPEKLRTYKGLEHLNDAEASEIIDALHQFSVTLICFMQELENDNQ